MTSPIPELLPGDHLNFSFSPSSPPSFPVFPSSTSSPFFDPSHQTSANEEEALMDADEPEYKTKVEDRLRRGPPMADTPGGDCKQLCVRHQRMANGGTNLMLQKSIENLLPAEQEAVNTIWSLFSSSPGRRRLLILRGLLTIACPSQLSFLQNALTLEMRIDPVDILPREVSLKIFGYLDAISLGRAAQVSRSWKAMADDDILWRTMCEQHIERKCEKCGWGLPMLSERRRKARAAREAKEREAREQEQELVEERRTTSSTGSSITADLWQNVHGSSMAVDTTEAHTSRPAKRAKTESPAPSRASTPAPMSPRTRSTSRNTSVTPLAPAPLPSTRPWKQVYCERLAIERNWRKGTHTVSILSGHQDSITCIQVAEDLPHPNFPVLMTGSWDRTVRIWNIDTGKEVGVVRGHTRGIRALQFDAVKLVTGSMDSTLKIWNWRTGECLRTLHGHADAVLCLAYDRQLLVSGSADHTIRVWDFGTGEVFALRGHTEWVNSVALWDSNTGEANTWHEGDMGRPVNDPKVAKESSRGKFLFSASDDSTIRVWDLYTRECVRVLRGHVAQVQSLRVITAEPNGESGHPAAGGSDAGVATNPFSAAAVSAANAATSTIGEERDDEFLPVDGPVCLASTSRQGAVVPPARLSNVMQSAPSTMPLSEALLPLNLAREKKPVVVSASLDNTLKVWDVEAGTCDRTMFGHIEGVWDVDVDKLRIVSGSHDRTLKIWDKESGRNLHTLVGHTGAVTTVTLQDACVVSGGDDGTVRVWRFS